MITLKPTLTFHPQPEQGKHWIVIGAGGNGGYYIPNLARVIALANRKLKLAGRNLHRLTIIDADDVEDKNLNRQNFIDMDIGKKKAEVLATRYGRAFGLEIQYVDRYLDSQGMLSSFTRSSGIPVVVGAVDNNKTRAIVYQEFKAMPGMFWLDAGNEEWGGQVVLGYSMSHGKATEAHEKQASRPLQFHMPSVAELYPEILLAQDKLPHEQSCAERAVSAPQNIFTNQMAANLMMGFTNLIINADVAKNEGIKHHAVAFNARTCSFTTRLNTLENLQVEEPKVPEVKVEVARVERGEVEAVTVF